MQIRQIGVKLVNNAINVSGFVSSGLDAFLQMCIETLPRNYSDYASLRATMHEISRLLNPRLRWNIAFRTRSGLSFHCPEV